MMLFTFKKIITMILILLLLLGLVGCGTQNKADNSYTKQQFNKIKPGMTYNKVTNILGSDGKAITKNQTDLYQTSVYLWGARDGTNMTITFQNGEVTSKTQNDLK